MTYVIITIGVLLLTLLVNMLRSIPPKKKRQVPPSHYKGRMIVDLERCYLLSSETPDEPFVPDIHRPFASALDPEMYDQDTQKSSFNTVIVFENEGRKFYSRPVDKDKTTVTYYMISKKKTTIYYDLRNPANYFFDLSFLEG